MVSCNSEKNFIKDQIISFNTAVKEIVKIRTNYEKHMLGDFRGDNEKVLDALEQAIKHLKAERKNLKETYFGRKTSKFTPRKFFYQETVYFGTSTKIEWTNKGLNIIEGERLEFPDEFEKITINPSDETWKQFEENLRNLNLKPVEPGELILDGMEVECHITFKTKLVQFNIINPDFENYEKLRELVNNLTICDDFPEGAFVDEEETGE